MFSFCVWIHESTMFQNHIKNCMFLVKKLMLAHITHLKEDVLVTAFCLQNRLDLLISVCMIGIGFLRNPNKNLIHSFVILINTEYVI
jgi:hypothetical protein